MNLSLWFEEEEETEQKKEKPSQLEKTTEHKCACGRAVCCGKHKKGQCSCQKKQNQRS